jgi:hypothetical protein
MKKKCPTCRLINYATAENCLRCQSNLIEISAFDTPVRKKSLKLIILKRAAVCLFAILFTVFGFYLSLIGSAERLDYNKKQIINDGINLLDEKGFSGEVFLLRYLTAYRATDNWLNSSIEKENAYAATNFPFEVMTVYEDFFIYPNDDTERAAILLHEAQHLKGADEKEAYIYVWKNRKKLGWTKEKYRDSVVWRNVRRQTKEIAPELFVCDVNEYADCTQ